MASSDSNEWEEAFGSCCSDHSLFPPPPPVSDMISFIPPTSRIAGPWPRWLMP